LHAVIFLYGYGELRDLHSFPTRRSSDLQRVLVVDDEVGVAEALAEMLGRDGHTVDVANDGARALELLETGTYDVIVSDTRMPVLDGEAFYAELERRFPALCRRFIFLTGDVLNSDQR